MTAGSRPRATLRLQFNGTFTFEHAARHVGYFADLGISHLYASPILKAHSASTHGYDLVDPTEIDPRLGGMDGLRDLVAALRERGMGLIVDVVPNHMSIHGSQNPWWQDLLARGLQSPFARFFDIDWESADPALCGKVLLPILGAPIEAAIERGELRLDGEATTRFIRYHEHRFPLRPEDQARARDLPLRDLLSRQNYVLAAWSEAPDRINWRRFFDINELAALRIDENAVFESTHRLLFALYEQGLVDGFRIDHIDGLADPGGYCRRLSERLSAVRRPSGLPQRPYLVVEKILAHGEALPDWPVAGTTGYDFMNEVSAWLHAESGMRELGALWRELTGDPRSFAAIDREARAEILLRNFPAELRRCARQFRLEFPGKPSLAALSEALREILAVMPAYRTYLGADVVSTQDQAILALVRSSLPENSGGVAEAICIHLAGKPVSPALQPAVTRFQQLSATTAAKGTEDTAFYRYGASLSRNEVGAGPGLAALSSAALHDCAADRAQHYPAAMLATATHDTKRGEDARARLAVLTELPGLWAEKARAWLGTGPDAPHPGDQLMLFQTLVGAWPMDQAAHASEPFIDRILRWQTKSLREGKLRSSWGAPDEAYERRCASFLRRLLAERRRDIAAFVARIAPAGAINSLSQLTLKLTMPGVPDFYQGCELWDLSLVDPDNRGAVDFEVRERLLHATDSIATLLSRWRTGEVKQAIIARLLDLRRRMPDAFAHGAYHAMEIDGELASHAIAFGRTGTGCSVLVVATRHAASLPTESALPLVSAAAWRDTRIPATADLTDVLSGRVLRAVNGSLFLSDVLRVAPVAILTHRQGRQ